MGSEMCIRDRVAAYGGYDLVMEAYHTALKEDYRFGTYGDAMLILDK